MSMASAHWPIIALIAYASLVSSDAAGQQVPQDDWAEPPAIPKSTCAARGAEEAMPDLAVYVLRTDPKVTVSGKVIKGMYFSALSGGMHDLAAFWNACYLTMEGRPFLIFDFRTSGFFFDKDRDGCADAVGILPQPEVDPMDFHHGIEDAQTYCYYDRIPM